MLSRALVAAALILFPMWSHAAVFKCRGADGAVIYSNEPCETQGARKDRTLGKADLQANRMRMRPRPSQTQEGEAQFGSGSAYQGQVPFKDRAGGPPQRSAVVPGS
jgi:hypothetical protein